MAEMQFAGVTFKGGRLVAIVMALSTLGGGAWGVFEAYARYQAMEKKIASYSAPDLSGFDKSRRLPATSVMTNGAIAPKHTRQSAQ